MPSGRLLLWLLRLNAGVLLLAAPCALLPFGWMEAIHREALGLGSLPDFPIVKYMARSLSLTYALHGVMVLAVTFDWPRYRPLVPLLARLHIGFGCAMLVLDWQTGLPWWWISIEGPTIIAVGLLILAVCPRASHAGDKRSEVSRNCD